MLVLTRKVGEEIVVPEYGLVIRVNQVLRGKVRLGVTAPEKVAIFRHEVWERVQAEALPGADPGGRVLLPELDGGP